MVPFTWIWERGASVIGGYVGIGTWLLGWYSIDRGGRIPVHR